VSAQNAFRPAPSALEVARNGVQVNAVARTTSRTPHLLTRRGAGDEGHAPRLLADVPNRRFATSGSRRSCAVAGVGPVRNFVVAQVVPFAGAGVDA
jgi:NAD(P)-dependent dehydrogenase (short-subunit alcohol dehydrogenase family)